MKKFFYRVIEGDSIISICQKFKCSVGTLIYNNNLKKEISAGDILLIEKCDNLYLVKPTDTIKSLAKVRNSDVKGQLDIFSQLTEDEAPRFWPPDAKN